MTRWMMLGIGIRVHLAHFFTVSRSLAAAIADGDTGLSGAAAGLLRAGRQSQAEKLPDASANAPAAKQQSSR